MKETGRLPLHVSIEYLIYFYPMLLQRMERNKEKFVSFEWLFIGKKVK